MKIIIVGNLGYIGPCVTHHFRSRFPKAELIGYDIGYYAQSLSSADYLPEIELDRQIFGDVRKFPEALLEGVDGVVNLAAISNDPMGNQYEAVTMAVNYRAAVDLAALCKRNKVGNYVFASSCSIYGAASEFPKKEDDTLNPLTAYARSKVAAELELNPLADEDFNVTCLRFATACGFSNRLRLDLVLNDFTAGAWVNQVIEILSDGTPWRPMINTKDMARAIEWAIQRTASTGTPFLAINTGSNEWNNQILPLAEAVATEVPGTRVNLNLEAMPDKRSYQVNFDLFKELAPDYQPEWDLERTIRELTAGLKALNFNDVNFRQSSYVRLHALTRLREQGLINERLEWTRLAS
jgi:nucleoside-diphosphate-sugar epimerase